MIAFCLLAIAVDSPQPPAVRAYAEVTPTRITLSETVRVTIIVKGPAPLRVEMPALPLTQESKDVWRVVRAEPPRLEKDTDGSECWSQAFVLDWWGTGDTGEINFEAITVRAGNEVKPRQMTCEKRVVSIDLGSWKKAGAAELAAARDAARVTSIEELPDPVQSANTQHEWLVAGGGVGIVVVLFVIVLVRRRRSKAPPLSPLEAARTEFAQMKDSEIARRVPAVLREYLAREFGTTAPRQTSAELLAEANLASWPAGLDGILAICDRANFGGEHLNLEEARSLLSLARAWVEATQPVSNMD